MGQYPGQHGRWVNDRIEPDQYIYIYIACDEDDIDARTYAHAHVPEFLSVHRRLAMEHHGTRSSFSFIHSFILTCQLRRFIPAAKKRCTVSMCF